MTIKLHEMKKILLLLSATAVLYACGNQDANKTDDTTKEEKPVVEEPKTNDLSSNPDYTKGLELVAQSDCLTCHKVEEKHIGPAYREVANKYASDDKTIDTLANKIIKGGAGVWGPTPMTPHPAIPLEDAKQMVKYILLLKNN
jgi:cytochrome c